MGRGRHLLLGKARASLLWGLVVFLVCQAALVVCTEGCRPELGDPEYGRKLASLRARLAERPGRPLAVVLGTSRVALGLRPGLLGVNHASSAEEPLVFNFGIMGCHPVQQLLYLRRLLADGVHPDHFVIEVWPAWLRLSRDEVDLVDVARLRRREVRLLERYAGQPEDLRERWWEGQLCPWYAHRVLLWNHYLPAWLPWKQRVDKNWQGMDDWGWVQVAECRSRPSLSRRLKILPSVAARWQAYLTTLHISVPAEDAFREMLALCRQRQIDVTLLLLPEGIIFRSWYNPINLAAVERSIHGWAREYGATVIDARAWAADEDFAGDDVHLNYAGAAAFTRRFEREVLPLLRGRRPVPNP